MKRLKTNSWDESFDLKRKEAQMLKLSFAPSIIDSVHIETECVHRVHAEFQFIGKDSKVQYSSKQGLYTFNGQDEKQKYTCDQGEAEWYNACTIHFYTSSETAKLSCITLKGHSKGTLPTHDWLVRSPSITSRLSSKKVNNNDDSCSIAFEQSSHS